MNFRSVEDLFRTVRQNIHMFPPGIDLVVGVPRSGMVAATAVSLALNCQMTDLNSFLEGKIYGGFSGRQGGSTVETFKKILIVDDSIFSGNAFREVRRAVGNKGDDSRLISAAIYGAKSKHDEVDIVLEVCPMPRVFEWNVMNHSALSVSCVDLDGVLCCDPTEDENDDGELYEKFLSSAQVINAPKFTINSIVTSRLEKYRELTEIWLRKNDIKYDNLFMLNLSSAEERRRLRIHAKFKADIFKCKKDCSLFIESETWQAETIHNLSGKSALAYKDMIFFDESFGVAVKEKLNRRFKRGVSRILPQFVKTFVRG